MVIDVFNSDVAATTVAATAGAVVDGDGLCLFSTVLL